MCNRHHQSNVEQSGISMWVNGLNLNQWRRMLKPRHHWLKLLDPSSCEIIRQESQRRYSAEDLSQSQALKTWAFHFMAKSPSPSWVLYKGGNYYKRDLFLLLITWRLHVAFTILCSAISDWLAALSTAIIYYHCKASSHKIVWVQWLRKSIRSQHHTKSQWRHFAKNRFAECRHVRMGLWRHARIFEIRRTCRGT